MAGLNSFPSGGGSGGKNEMEWIVGPYQTIDVAANTMTTIYTATEDCRIIICPTGSGYIDIVSSTTSGTTYISGHFLRPANNLLISGYSNFNKDMLKRDPIVRPIGVSGMYQSLDFILYKGDYTYTNDSSRFYVYYAVYKL